MPHVALRALVLLLGGASIARAQAGSPPPAADTARRLPAVIVTATRDTISPLASPLPTGVLTAVELRRDHGVSLAQTLTRLPGVRSLGTGEQIGKPVIRGLSGARVLVLDDGLRVEDFSWSDEDGPSVDARLAERVEVIRGPASVLYGSDALGGVVNAIPAPIPDAHGGPPIHRGQVELYGASNNRELGTVLGYEGARGRAGGRIVFVGRRAQDVHTPAGDIRHTGFAAGNGEAAFGVHHDGGAESAVRLAHYGGEFKLLEIDAPPGGPVAADEGPDRITLDDRLQATHRRRVGALDVEARGQLQRHLLQERADLPNPEPGQPREATVFDLLLNTATVELLAHHGVGAGAAAVAEPSAVAAVATERGLRGTVGVSGMHQRNDSRGIIPLVPDATVSGVGAFAFERLSLGRLALLAGVRGDARQVDAAADPRLDLAHQRRSHAAVTGDVGAVYRVGPALALAVNAGRAWRAPTLFELFANGPRLGEGRYEYGRPTLEPESSLNVDASVRWLSPHLRVEAAAFRTRVHDFIFISPTDTQRDGLRVYRYDQAEATLVGGELAAAVEATEALTLHGRVDGVRGTNTTTDDPLPLMPPVRAALGAEVHAPAGRFGHPYLDVEVEHVAEQTRLSRAEREATVAPDRFPLTTQAYTLLDVGAGLELPLAGHPTHLDLRARNATNRQYRDFLNRYKEFAYSPGASVVLRISTTL